MWSEPILHVDMDAFFVEVERLREPSLRGRPVAVGGTGERGVIASASYEARRHGVRSAMPTARARRACPELVVVPPDHVRYAQVSEALFALLRDVTPLVEGLSVDEAFLDVRGLRRHVASPLEVAAGVRSRIRAELGLPASVGVAATKLVAKLASQDAKPDGVRHVPLEDQVEFLHALPVRALWGVGEATHAALAGLGVETVGELASIPPPALARAVGETVGDHLVRLAHGDDPRPVVPDAEAKSVSAEETYPSDLRGRAQLAAAVRTHADRVATRLRRSGVQGRTVTLKVRYADFVTLTRSHTVGTATDAGRAIAATALRLLETVELDRPVRLLGVAVSGLVPASRPRQLAMLEDARWEAVEATVDRIRARFGVGAVDPPGWRIAGRAVREGDGEEATEEGRRG